MMTESFLATAMTAFFFRNFASALVKGFAIAFEVTVGAVDTEDVLGGLHEESS